MSQQSTTATYLRLAGLQLALVVAAVHLVVGLPRFLKYLSAGAVPDPLTTSIVVSAVALVLGVLAAYEGAPRRPLYALGILLMAGYVLGYAAWHVTDHGQHVPFLHSHAGAHEHEHGHDGGALGTVLFHLGGDPLALIAYLAEFGLAAVLGALLVLEDSEASAGADAEDQNAPDGETRLAEDG